MTLENKMNFLNDLPDYESRKMLASQVLNHSQAYQMLQRSLMPTMSGHAFDELCHELEDLIATRWGEASEEDPGE